ncbi:hypothetical protein ACFL6X_07725 [Candidatus Latescibacterota bacterium]
MVIPIVRQERPRLYRAVDDPDFSYTPPADVQRQRILANMVADCRQLSRRRPWRRVPLRPDSPHPFHQLYITFYTGIQASALIEQYAFAWRLTGEARWLQRARAWLAAAARWEHGDHVEEHFYTANRYMHAFAVALDLLQGQLRVDEEAAATDCLVSLMQRWWPEVDANRHAPTAGHHVVVDNGHFGVAALHLLGAHSEAEEWVAAVVDRFRAAVMPHGCGPRGEPLDGGSFWTWENLWMLHFADALRNVTGIDLIREHRRRLARPLDWFRYHQVSADGNLEAGARRMWSPVLLRLSQEDGDESLRAAALADPDLGRLYRYEVGVKGSTAECMIAHGPYAYLYCDPHFSGGGGGRRGKAARRVPSRKFREGTRDTAVLRSGWGDESMVAHISGYGGRVAGGLSDLQVAWRGASLLRTISCEEARPLGCGSLPCVGGQNEFVLVPGGLTREAGFDRLAVRSTRVDTEYWLLRGGSPLLVVGTRRRRRGLRVAEGSGGAPARLNGRDYLQYPRADHFSPASGRVRMRVRLRQPPNPERLQVLWGTGLGVPGLLGTQVNVFALGFFGGQGLCFAVQSQRYTRVEVRLPPGEAQIEPGRWHDITATWGGLNDPGGHPFISLSVDGRERRFDDPAAFGELGHDSQNLKSRASPRTFYVHPNTVLAFGGAVQMPDTGTACDLSFVEVRCPGRQPLTEDFAEDLSRECGSGELEWKLNPVDLRRVSRHQARLGAGSRCVDVHLAWPPSGGMASESVPFAPSGLAAGSLRHFGVSDETPATRLRAGAGRADHLALVFAPSAAGARVEPLAGGFAVVTRDGRRSFTLGGPRGPILSGG